MSYRETTSKTRTISWSKKVAKHQLINDDRIRRQLFSSKPPTTEKTTNNGKMSSESDSVGRTTGGVPGSGDGIGVGSNEPLQQKQQQPHQQYPPDRPNIEMSSLGADPGGTYGSNGMGLHLAASNAQLLHQTLPQASRFIGVEGMAGVGPALPHMVLPSNNLKPMISGQSYINNVQPQLSMAEQLEINTKAAKSQLEENVAERGDSMAITEAECLINKSPNVAELIHSQQVVASETSTAILSTLAVTNSNAMQSLAGKEVQQMEIIGNGIVAENPALPAAASEPVIMHSAIPQCQSGKKLTSEAVGKSQLPPNPNATANVASITHVNPTINSVPLGHNHHPQPLTAGGNPQMNPFPSKGATPDDVAAAKAPLHADGVHKPTHASASTPSEQKMAPKLSVSAPSALGLNAGKVTTATSKTTSNPAQSTLLAKGPYHLKSTIPKTSKSQMSMVPPSTGAQSISNTNTKTNNSLDPHQFGSDPGRPLSDPQIVAATNDIISLLQLCGPLSYHQLKFNIATQLGSQQSIHRSEGDRLQHVLDILVELGVIHVVNTDTKKMPPPTEAESPAFNSNPTQTDDANLVYCFGRGIPRMDVVLPSQLLEKIHETGDEVQRTQKRIEILRSALLGKKVSIEDQTKGGPKEPDTNEEPKDDTSGSRKRKRDEELKPHKSTRILLKQMLDLHPEIVYDPVYASALRMFNVELGKLAPKLDGADGKSDNSNKGSAPKRPSTSAVAPNDGVSTKKRKKGRPSKSNSSSNNLGTATAVTADNNASLSGSPVAHDIV